MGNDDHEPTYMNDGIDNLLERYYAGTCTAAERVRVEAWAAADPARQAYLERGRVLGEAWRGAREETDREVDPSAAWMQMRRALSRGSRIDRPSIGGTHVPLRRRATLFSLYGGTAHPEHLDGRSRVARAMGVAAMIVVAAGVGVLIGHERRQSAPFREFATPAGGRATVTLRDGTQLVLGPASRVRVPADFGRRARTLELSGEAYLTVVHDAARPLAVRTTFGDVRDIGTTFAVRAYGDDQQMRVAVVEGEVAVGTAPGLRAGDVAAVDAGGQVQVKRGVNLAPDLAWVQGGLAFDGVPLRDVIRDVARAFNLTITIADSTLGAEHVTASFGSEPADAVLAEVTGVVGGTYERSGNTVVIRRRSAASGPSREREMPAMTDARRVQAAFHGGTQPQ
jgi:ferric-dicitrate binding protein FerR (iron transport regulator)